jgi:tetratricopeptide (TPR) repeat protein
MFISLSGVAVTVVGNWATAHQPLWLERLLAAHQVVVWIGLGVLAAVGGMLSVVAVRVGLSAAAPDHQAVAAVGTMCEPEQDAVVVLGHLVGDLQDGDAFDFEVHRALDIGEGGLTALPSYLERQHDVALRDELMKAQSGSRMVLLLGGSSTGKTRASWEAVRDVLPDWTIWHPLAPDRPSALVEAILANAPGPRTVVWLNEVQMYLGPDGTGEQAAASLQELLRRDASTPVVVLGSLWPEHLARLTHATSGEHPAAAALLRQAVIVRVPSEFSDRDLEENGDQIAADPRLQWAADGSNRIAQRLAGAPELVRRYTQAGPHARAVVQAAMDARRLSAWIYLPRDFLLRAGPGYIGREEWEQTPEGDEWFDQAIEYLSLPCHGTRGVLSRGRSTPGATVERGGYQLADYLDELGHTERAPYSPPGTFWSSAVETCADPGVLVELAEAALARGRLKRADELAHRAADLGHPHALRIIARHQAELGDQSTADELYRESVERGDVGSLWLMARRRERSGDQAGADRLYREAADRGDANALRHLAWRREGAGDTVGADALMQEAAERGDSGATTDLGGNPGKLARVLRMEGIQWERSLGGACARGHTRSRTGGPGISGNRLFLPSDRHGVLSRYRSEARGRRRPCRS